MEYFFRGKEAPHIEYVTPFSFFPDNTNLLWSLDLTLWLSPHGFDPHLPTLSQRRCSFPRVPQRLSITIICG